MMFHRSLFLLSFLTIMSFPADAQQKHDWEEYFSRLYDEDYEQEDYQDVYERLCELEENPLNINTATIDEIAQIPCLSMVQISDIIEYRDRYGEMKTMEELALIPSIDKSLRLFLSCFFEARETETAMWYSREGLKASLKQHHGTVLASLNVPLYTREGYKTGGKTDENAYLGGKYRYGIRYTGKVSSNVRYGFVGAQDAREPLFSGGNSGGMDYYSYFVNVKNIGRLKDLMLGCYRLRFGMGLVMNTNGSLGKQTMLSSLSPSSSAVTGHVSRTDANYLRGCAATVDLGKEGGVNKFDFTAFYSIRDIDATLNDNGSVSTIITNGYHRTPAEMRKKHNTSHISYGGHLAWKYLGWHAGVTAVADWFNRDLSPNSDTPSTLYRRYYPKGNSFWNVGADYGYISARLFFSGETATGNCGSIATINSMEVKLSDSFTVTGIQRFYSYRYYAIQSNAFSDGGRVQNESGMYISARWNVGKSAMLDLFTDYSYFPWKKYLVSQSSVSWDSGITLTETRKKWDVICRYRLRHRQRDNSSKSGLYNRMEHRLKITSAYHADALSLQTQLNVSSIALENNRRNGYMLGETASYSLSDRLAATLGFSYFDTEDYDSRIYTYEKSMQYSFAMPSFYGNGIRSFLFLSAKLNRHFKLCGKAGYTKCFDRKSIGSYSQMISASYQTDVDLQLKYKF